MGYQAFKVAMKMSKYYMVVRDNFKVVKII
jgi:hypothetical protein